MTKASTAASEPMRGGLGKISLIASVMLLTTVGAWAQEFPTKPIRIVTSAPGGGSDFSARLIAQGLTLNVGQPVIVDNRSGVVPAELAAKSPPDGYTLL